MPVTDTKTIRGEIREFIAESFFIGEDSSTFSDSDSFMEQGIVDSTGVLELTTFLEEKYNITVEDDEMTPDNLDSIDNLVGYLNEKLN